MTYTDAMHRAAVQLVGDAQLDRAVVGRGIEPEDSDRAIESMAPENTGSRPERFGTIVTRARIAAVDDRSERRRAALTDGTVRTPLDLSRFVGHGNRAARRAAARQARATRKGDR